MQISKRTLRILVATGTLLMSTATLLAATITGVVTNRTTDKPSAGDTIAVINTAQSMDEIAKATSDAQGRYSVNAPDGGQILLHVTHAGAEYFKSVSSGSSSADIDVYDSARKIDGIAGEALVLRAETDADGKALNVAENFFVQNTSTPPRTEYGGDTFDFYLPKGAQIQQSLASSPGGLPTNTKVVPIDAASGHYAFTFPVRPGESRFQVSYSLPYSGQEPFALKLSVPTGDVAVMLPKTMQFQPTSAFQAITDPSVGQNSQSFDEHQPALGQPVQFTIAGTGQLPEEPAESGSSGQTASQMAAGGQRPGGGLGAPEDPGDVNDPWAKYKWWILGILGLALAAGAGIMLKSTPTVAVAGDTPPSADVPIPAVTYSPVVVTPPAVVAATTSTVAVASTVATTAPLVQALKDELFELETDRHTGRLSEADYAQQKAALDVVLRRALNRQEPQ